MTADLTEKHKRAEGLLALAPGRAPPPEVMSVITLATLMLVDEVKIFNIDMMITAMTICGLFDDDDFENNMMMTFENLNKRRLVRL